MARNVFLALADICKPFSRLPRIDHRLCRAVSVWSATSGTDAHGRSIPPDHRIRSTAAPLLSGRWIRSDSFLTIVVVIIVFVLLVRSVVFRFAFCNARHSLPIVVQQRIRHAGPHVVQQQRRFWALVCRRAVAGMMDFYTKHSRNPSAFVFCCTIYFSTDVGFQNVFPSFICSPKRLKVE